MTRIHWCKTACIGIGLILGLMFGVAGEISFAQGETSGLLSIPPRPYEQSDFCGEVCMQEVLLYSGRYYTQLQINLAGGGDGVRGLWEGEIETALDHLQVIYTSWELDAPDYWNYIDLLKSKLAQGHPVLVGVKINPTEHPEWSSDHFILLLDYTSDSFIYNSPSSREQRSFLQFRDGNPDGTGYTLTNPYNVYYGVEFIVSPANVYLLWTK